MSDNAELIDLVQSFDGTRMLVIGDLIVDHYIWGRVDRISPEAPVVVVQVTEEGKRIGGAGNVAHNLAKLGADVTVCGVVGSDAEGEELLGLCRECHIDTRGVVSDGSRPTTKKSRVIAHAQQVVRVDHEVAETIDSPIQERLSEKILSQFSSTRGVVISDYGKGTITPRVFDDVKGGYDQGLLGFGRIPVLVDPKAPNFKLYSKATIMKPNRKEAEEASGYGYSFSRRCCSGRRSFAS